MKKKKPALLATVLTVVLVLDLWTKRWALEALGDGSRIELFGGLLPLTLAFNRGAAFGISIGNDPRWFFIPVTVIAVVLLLFLYVRAERSDHLRLVSLALVMSGALGNLFDRIRWNRGVVDFLGPIDLGFMYWPIFNVADMAISCGAVLLAVSFWMEEQAAAGAGPEPRPSSTDAGPEADPVDGADLVDQSRTP